MSKLIDLYFSSFFPHSVDISNFIRITLFEVPLGVDTCSLICELFVMCGKRIQRCLLNVQRFHILISSLITHFILRVFSWTLVPLFGIEVFTSPFNFADDLTRKNKKKTREELSCIVVNLILMFAIKINSILIQLQFFNYSISALNALLQCPPEPPWFNISNEADGALSLLFDRVMWRQNNIPYSRYN